VTEWKEGEGGPTKRKEGTDLAPRTGRTDQSWRGEYGFEAENFWSLGKKAHDAPKGPQKDSLEKFGGYFVGKRSQGFDHEHGPNVRKGMRISNASSPFSVIHDRGEKTRGQEEAWLY